MADKLLTEVLGPKNYTKEDKEIVSVLLGCGQGHLFEDWPTAPQDADNKRDFLAQVRQLNGQYPGGIKAYVKKGARMLEESKNGLNSFAGYTPHHPDIEPLHFASADFFASEQLGVDAAADSACVIVAGGLGERLGFSGIKVALPTELSSGKCFLQLFAEHIRSLELIASKTRGGADVTIPLAIMTSADTHDRTVDLLKFHSNFGLRTEQIHFMRQEKVPTILDATGKLARTQGMKYELLTKPHGHGDVHFLLHTTGLAKRWVDDGKKWVMFFQDTNPMVFRTLPAALGVSVRRGFTVNSVAVPRKAKAAVGALMKLTHHDGHDITINVEYNQIEALLRSTEEYKDGDVNGTDGHSPFPGNVNQLIFALPPYVSTLAATEGLVPEFVNPKYADETKICFKSPTRLECMMQDYPRLLGRVGKSKRKPSFRNLFSSKKEHGSPNAVGVTQFFDQTIEDALIHRLYAPVKNNKDDAAAKAAKGVPDAGAASSEMAVYAMHCALLRTLGAKIAGPAQKRSIGGVELNEWPHIVFSPSFMPTFSGLAANFDDISKVTISSNSTLVVDGAEVRFGELELNGALVISAVPGASVYLKCVRVQNKGWEMVNLDHAEGPEEEAMAEEEICQIRGFFLRKQETCNLRFDTPGRYVVEIPHPSSSPL